MPQSVQITETSPLLHDANCVYCHVDLVLNDHAVVCERCKSPHHHDCWEANNDQCATFGCEDAGLIRSRTVALTENSRSVPLASRPPSDELRASLRAENDGVRIVLGMVGIVVLPILIYAGLKLLTGEGNLGTVSLLVGLISLELVIFYLHTEGAHSVLLLPRWLPNKLRMVGFAIILILILVLVLAGLMSLFGFDVAFSAFGLFGGLAFIYLLVSIGE